MKNKLCCKHILCHEVTTHKFRHQVLLPNIFNVFNTVLHFLILHGLFLTFFLERRTASLIDATMSDKYKSPSLDWTSPGDYGDACNSFARTDRCPLTERNEAYNATSVG